MSLGGSGLRQGEAHPKSTVALETPQTPQTSTRRREKREAIGPDSGETTSCDSAKAAKIRATSSRASPRVVVA